MDIKNTVLLIAFISSFLAPFMISAVNIAVPSINQEFHAEAVMLSWISTAYLLAACMFLLPIGRIADIHGRKKVFTYGIAIYTLSAVLLANAGSVLEFIAYRFIEGVGAAMIFSTGVAILTEVFPPGERGRALGINVAAVYIGLSLGPYIGGFLTENYGWRSVFYLNVPIGILAVALILWKLKGLEWAEARGERMDYFGSFLYIAALASLVHSLGNPSTEGLFFLVFSGVLAYSFFRYEEKARSPILDTRLLKTNRLFLFSNLSALINYSATYTVAFLLSLFLQYIKGMSPEQAGIVLITQPIIQAVFSPLAGRLSDKIEPGIVASAGMALTAAGLFMLSGIAEGTEINHVTGALIVLGLGFSLFSSPNTNAVMGSVEKKQYGVASAFLATMRLTGQMLATGITMTLFAIYLPKIEITPDVYPTLITTIKTAFTIAAGLCMIGVYTSLARGKK